MTESAAGRGCARPIADTRAPRPLGKSGAPPRSRSHRRRPSGDPRPLGSLGLPYQVSLTITVDVDPPYYALAWTGLPVGAGGPFPVRRLSSRERVTSGWFKSGGGILADQLHQNLVSRHHTANCLSHMRGHDPATSLPFV